MPRSADFALLSAGKAHYAAGLGGGSSIGVGGRSRRGIGIGGGGSVIGGGRDGSGGRSGGVPGGGCGVGPCACMTGQLPSTRAKVAAGNPLRHLSAYHRNVGGQRA